MDTEHISSGSTNVAQLPRLKIKFNRNGCPVGPKSTHFQNRVGDIVRTHVPIRYADWRHVDPSYKKDVWTSILREFDIPNYVKSSVEKSMPDVIRKYKTALRHHYLDNQRSLDAQKKSIPPGIRRDDWEQFCNNEFDEKQKILRVQNAKRRKLSVYGHTGGRKSAAMIEEEMMERQEDPTIPIPPAYVWIQNHTRKDKSVLPSAEPLMVQLKATLEERKANGKEKNNHPLSLDGDPLSEVVDTNKGLPGVGCHVSKRQYNASLHSHILFLNERGEKEMLIKRFDRMEAKLDRVLDLNEQHLSRTRACTVVVDGPMMSVPRNQAVTQAAGDGNSVTSGSNEHSSVAKLCELIDWEGNSVALAKEVIDPIHRGNCHNYVLKQFEMKVSMVTRKVFSAKLYKAHKHPDAKTIGEVGIGDFLVWPKASIRIVE